MSEKKDVRAAASGISSGMLLVSLLSSLIAIPCLAGLGSNRLVQQCLMTITIVVAVYAIRKKHAIRVPILVLAGIALPVAWVSAFVTSPILFFAHCLLFAVFFGAVGGIVIAVCVRQRFATLDGVLGAISAYLLFGLAWSFIYLAIVAAWPDAFRWPAEMMTASADPVGTDSIILFPKVVYYSMVTMSTLGYGDITPVSNIACTLAWMQSVTGQFYVAVLVAWLVSALPRPDIPEA